MTDIRIIPSKPKTCPYCARWCVLIVEGKERPYTNGYTVRCTICGSKFVAFFDKKPQYRKVLE